MLIGGDWHFIDPAEGMHLFDRSAQRVLVFRSGWTFATAPAAPAGGSYVDVEARAALAGLVEALMAIGLLSPAAT